MLTGTHFALSPNNPNVSAKINRDCAEILYSGLGFSNRDSVDRPNGAPIDVGCKTRGFYPLRGNVLSQEKVDNRLCV